ncbi:MAG: NAD(P)-dependent oxidoreductase [Gammaproteobacteria bacterium]|nr:NAD(P)-dependent oxidoreductase [Gammaproteobacteria bacterium]
MRAIVTGGSGFIGSFLCKKLSELGMDVYNYDIKEPVLTSYSNFVFGSILDRNRLFDVFNEVLPHYVFHLAAKADVFGKVIDDYSVNVDGTLNVIDACKSCGSVKHFLFTSTQLVNKPGVMNTTGEIYAPLDELYSRSKVNAEILIKNEVDEFSWTIFRPTNIWGPYHPRFPSQIWRYISKGWYIHPNAEIIRSYGYVENIVFQMASAIQVEPALVNHKIFYVGDNPIDSAQWVDAFSHALCGKPVRKFPLTILKFISQVGEQLKRLGIPCPIYMDRYRSMTSDYIVPMEPTFSVLGQGPYNLQQGVDRTVFFVKNGELDE